MLGVVSQAITLGNVARTCVSKPGRAHAIAPARALERCALSVSTRPVHATPRADNSAVGAPSPTPGSSVPCSAALVKTLHHMSMALVDPPGPRHASALHRPRPSRYTPTPPSPPRSFAVWSEALRVLSAGRLRTHAGGTGAAAGGGWWHHDDTWRRRPPRTSPSTTRAPTMAMATPRIRTAGASTPCRSTSRCARVQSPPPSRAVYGLSRLSRFIARLSPPPRSVEPKP